MMHPIHISWSAQSRFVVDELIELPEWAMSSSKFELLAGVADKEMKIGVIYVAEASNDIKQQNTLLPQQSYCDFSGNSRDGGSVLISAKHCLWLD